MAFESLPRREPCGELPRRAGIAERAGVADSKSLLPSCEKPVSKCDISRLSSLDDSCHDAVLLTPPEFSHSDPLDFNEGLPSD